jgi:hypothetical protein
MPLVPFHLVDIRSQLELISCSSLRRIGFATCQDSYNR